MRADRTHERLRSRTTTTSGRGGCHAASASGWPLSARHCDGEARKRQAKACGSALHKPALAERAECVTNIGLFAPHANDKLFERGRRATASKTEEGAEDVNLEAHAVTLRSALNVRPLKRDDFFERDL